MVGSVMIKSRILSFTDYGKIYRCRGMLEIMWTYFRKLVASKSSASSITEVDPYVWNSVIWQNFSEKLEGTKEHSAEEDFLPANLL